MGTSEHSQCSEEPGSWSTGKSSTLGPKGLRFCLPHTQLCNAGQLHWDCGPQLLHPQNESVIGMTFVLYICKEHTQAHTYHWKMFHKCQGHFQLWNFCFSSGKRSGKESKALVLGGCRLYRILGELLYLFRPFSKKSPSWPRWSVKSFHV